MASAKADIFKKALSRNVDDANLSREEAAKLTDSMENKEFQQLFIEYVEEISHPKHRAENEMATFPALRKYYKIYEMNN